MDIQAQISKKPPRKIYKWGQGNCDDIRNDSNIFRDAFMSDAPSRSVEENYSSIEKHLKTMLGKHIPCKMSRTRVYVPWLARGIKRQCRRKQRLYNRAKKSGKADHKAAYIRAHKSVQSALKQARWGYINDILQAGLDEGTSKPFWGYIRQQRQDNVGVSPLKKNGKLHVDSLSRCEILAYQFKSVFTKDSDDPLRDTALFGPSYPLLILLLLEKRVSGNFYLV